MQATNNREPKEINVLDKFRKSFKQDLKQGRCNSSVYTVQVIIKCVRSLSLWCNPSHHIRELLIKYTISKAFHFFFFFLNTYFLYHKKINEVNISLTGHYLKFCFLFLFPSQFYQRKLYIIAMLNTKLVMIEDDYFGQNFPYNITFCQSQKILHNPDIYFLT